MKSNIKAFWNYVNTKKSNGCGVTDFLKLDDRVAVNKSEAVDIFAVHFSSVYEADDDDVTDILLQNHEADEWVELSISLSVVHEKLMNLDVNKATGPDKLPPLFYQKCATTICIPLQLIFNNSLENGVFPEQWKLAHVTPIHKEGPLHDARNFRPISKLSIPAKVFDNILADEVAERFQDAIIPEQHGFFRKRSTVTNLVNYIERLMHCVDSGGQMDVVYTDFSKAFDKVSHAKLLRKLRLLGIAGPILQWFWSYLTGRSQRVQIGNFLSQPIEVPSSDVQGSHLGPILFTLFINDVGKILTDVDFCIYADDLKIFKQINTVKDAEVLQNSLLRLKDYVDRNRLTLNLKKCYITSFTKRTVNLVFHPYAVGADELLRTNSMRDLGVTFDSKLTFNCHIDSICGKAKRMLGFIMRVGKNFKDRTSKKLLYNALVRSNLEYASIIWNPFTAEQRSQLERVQHKFLRFISGKRLRRRDASDHVDYAQIEKELRLDTLALRRDIADVKFTINTHNGIIDGQTFIHNFRKAENSKTRANNVFYPVSSRTQTGHNSVFNRLMRTFNNLDVPEKWLKECPNIEQLKKHLRERSTQVIN